MPAQNSPGNPSLANVDSTLSGDVTMVNAGQYYDGPSALFGLGVWLVIYVMQFQTAISTQTEGWAVKLWDGSTVYDEKEVDTPSIGVGNDLLANGQAIITLTTPTTLKVSASSGRANQVIKRDTGGTPGNTHTATRLTGIRIT